MLSGFEVTGGFNFYPFRCALRVLPLARIRGEPLLENFGILRMNATRRALILLRP